MERPFMLKHIRIPTKNPEWIQSKKSPTVGPTERTPKKPEYLTALRSHSIFDGFKIIKCTLPETTFPSQLIKGESTWQTKEILNKDDLNGQIPSLKLTANAP